MMPFRIPSVRPSRPARLFSRLRSSPLGRTAPASLAAALLLLAGPAACQQHPRYKIHTPQVAYHDAGPSEDHPTTGLENRRGVLLVDHKTGRTWYIDASKGPDQIQWRRMERAGAPIEEAGE